MNKVDRQRDIKPHSKMENPEKKKITRQEKKNDMDVDNNDVLMGLNHMRIESNRNLMQNLYTNRSSTESSNLSDLPTDINYMYIERENNVLINNYGPDIYNFSKELESFEVPSNYLARHKIDSNVRTKMVDWIIEVLYAYSCDVPTFFLAVHLLDSYVYQSKTTLSINEFHLSGICCIYLASKMEDIIPLRMSHIKAKIGHNKFSEKEIKKREKMILTDIKFDVITTSTYDFINTFILDFKLNNKELIKRLDMNKHIDALSNVCIFLAKLMTLHDEFTPHKYSLKAICCIVTGFDILRSNSKTLNRDMENFMREWIIYLINQSQYNTDLVSQVYNRLVELYSQFDNVKYSSYNLNKTHNFFFY